MSMRMVGAALAGILLAMLSVSSASASVSIALSSPPLDNLVVVPGQSFPIYIRVYNNSTDGQFTAHLEVLGGLPVSFAINDFDLPPEKSRQVEVNFEIPSDWELGSVREGEIVVTALTHDEPSGGVAAKVLGSLSKQVVLTVGIEAKVPEETPESLPLTGFPSGLAVAVVAAVLMAVLALFATRRRWLHICMKKAKGGDGSKVPRPKKVGGAIFLFFFGSLSCICPIRNGAGDRIGGG